MVSAVPKWVWYRYSKLWQQFRDQPFTYKEAQEKVLKHDDKNILSVMLNELKSAEWITVELDKKDSRIRIYRLKPPTLLVETTTYDSERN